MEVQAIKKFIKKKIKEKEREKIELLFFTYTSKQITKLWAYRTFHSHINFTKYRRNYFAKHFLKWF